ncbi:MAG: pyridoxal phosphate-dependent aminotransferase [Chloroflexota bacterium]
MTQAAVSAGSKALYGAMALFMEGMGQFGAARQRSGDRGADFLAGNPQEMALPALVDALQRWSVPQTPDWFGYKMPDRHASETAAAALSQRLGLAFDPDDIILSRGAHGGLALALQAVVDPGDEVIFISPPWFFYESLILGAGARPVKVRVQPDTFELDIEAIAAALSPRTRALILNTPHNPTGRIFGPASLERLAALLNAASEDHGRPIYLIADEAYNRIIFDGRPFHSPGRFYARSFLIQTYSKSALAPGQRLGYIALPPTMPGREEIRQALMLAGFAHGPALPDAVMQYALPEIEPLLIDLAALQRRRDRLVEALRAQGYTVPVPEATFYLLPRSPLADDVAFAAALAERDVFVLPGRAVELPGYFRLSLTATDAMVERALPIFAAAIAAARAAGQSHPAQA